MQDNTIDDSEVVVRIVSSEWVVDGELQQSAFMLNPRETYLSVNRPVIDSYEADVRSFVLSHDKFLFDDGSSYRIAPLSVLDIRAISVYDEDNQKLNINVEVEPRDTHTKSHAGIFVRSGAENIIPNRQISDSAIPKTISTDMVLQEVRWEFLNIAQLKKCMLESLDTKL